MIETDDTMEPRWQVRICLAAFRDTHVWLPRLIGRAQLRRHSMKLQWWEAELSAVFDVAQRRLPGTSIWELIVEEGYGCGSGFRVVFAPVEPDGVIWVLGVMSEYEPLTSVATEIFQARLNVVMERRHISRDNPLGIS